MPASWAVDPPGLGRFQPRTGSSVQFTAGPKGGQGTVTATAAGLTASTTLTVGPGPLHVASIRYGIGAAKTLLVTVSLADLRGRPVRDAFVSVSRPPPRLPVLLGARDDRGERPRDVPRPPQEGVLPHDGHACERGRVSLGSSDTRQHVLQVTPPGYNPAPQGVFPSGQRGRAVNPLALPSEVRILPPPFTWVATTSP